MSRLYDFWESGYQLLTSQYFLSLLKGLEITLYLSLLSVGIGFILAMIYALLELSRFKIIRYPATLFVTLVRSLPELVVIFLIGLGIPYLYYLGVDYNLPLIADFHQSYLERFGREFEFSDFLLGAVALSLIYASYASQTLRGALLAVPKSQWDSGAVLGLSKVGTFFYIILPQMMRHAFPGLGNQWLVLLKDTALIALLGVHELMEGTRKVYAATGQGFTWFFIAALLYLGVSMVSQYLQAYFYKRITHYDHDEAIS